MAPKESDTYELEVIRVLAHPDDETDYDGDVLGVGVDFPEDDVFVEWRRGAFPNELESPHVSIYGSVSDLQLATESVIERVGTYDALDNRLFVE